MLSIYICIMKLTTAVFLSFDKLLENIFVKLYLFCQEFDLTGTQKLLDELAGQITDRSLSFDIGATYIYTYIRSFIISFCKMGLVWFRGVSCSIDFESLPMPDLKKLPKIVSFANHTSIFCPFVFLSSFSPFSLSFYPLFLPFFLYFSPRIPP